VGLTIENNKKEEKNDRKLLLSMAQGVARLSAKRWGAASDI